MNKIGIIGLGYVGLPLATEFAKKNKVIGFDINFERVNELKRSFDKTLEVLEKDLAENLLKDIEQYTNSSHGFLPTIIEKDLKNCNFYIITVPTPIDINHNPILKPLENASQLVAKYLKKGDIVVYESTVYPGVTEEFCVPILEKISKLKFNIDFFAGYSPERINPGDKIRTLTKIVKVTSGSTKEIALHIDKTYKSIIKAGTHLAPSIKVAEASKVIENSQRDVNIAFVNELSRIFNLIGINTEDVLEAAGTKWNFLPFKPGLVGGHCIGVDPYYLSQKSQQLGYYPELILTARRINENMGVYVASSVIKLCISKAIDISNAIVLILGFSFKENCPDFRNTKVIDVFSEMKKYALNVSVYDPWVSKKDVFKSYNIKLLDNLINLKFDVIILAVSHNEFLEIPIKEFLNDKSVLFDVKGIYKQIADGSL